MTDSILDSIKVTLNLDPENTDFDQQILLFVNGVFSDLTQLGIGPDSGFNVPDASVIWQDFMEDDPRLNSVKTYVYLRVRVLFDPPSTSFVLDAMNQQIQELAWRINVRREEEMYQS